MAEHGDYLAGLLRRDAHICNKRHLESAVEQAVGELLETDAPEQATWQLLSGQGRLHGELY